MEISSQVGGKIGKRAAMQKLLSYQKALANILATLILALMFLIVVDVGGRFLLNKPLQGGVEISQIVLVWILFSGLAYALIQGAHVRVTLLLTYMGRRFNLAAEMLIRIASLIFFAFVIYGGWVLFWDSFLVGETMPAPIWLPLWAAKLAVPIGFSLIFVQLCFDLVAPLQAGKKTEEIDTKETR